MKNIFCATVLFCATILQSYCQTRKIDKVSFFEDTSILTASLTTDLVHLNRQRTKEGKKYPGRFTISFPGDSSMEAPVLVELRGHMRRDICAIPPIRLHFNKQKAGPFSDLGTLKLVNECRNSGIAEDYLIREFLIYKMYNLITDLSFKIRLLKLTLTDSSNKKKQETEYAFLMEDIKDVAKRNNCFELKKAKLGTRSTNSRQATIVSVFEYMIGNTDWSVPANHNSKLIMPANDSVARPYIIPYDFDYSGLVNATYAIPDENLDIDNVRQRLYRGFPCSIDELNEVLDIFKKQKDNIYGVFNNCSLISSGSKKDIRFFLDGFFDIINDPRMSKSIFITNARKQ